MHSTITTATVPIGEYTDNGSGSVVVWDDDAASRLFEALAADSWKHPAETTVDITLVGRYYERFADHAVSVARRVVYLVTGERPLPVAAAS